LLEQLLGLLAVRIIRLQIAAQILDQQILGLIQVAFFFDVDSRAREVNFRALGIELHGLIKGRFTLLDPAALGQVLRQIENPADLVGSQLHGPPQLFFGCVVLPAFIR